MYPDILWGLITGISLSAACGFRVFVPLLVMSIASFTGYMELSEGYDWIASLPAVIAFSTATLLEIAGYYNPWIDNALDMLSSPLAIIAGVITTSAMIADINPFLKWTAGIVCGGGAAMLMQIVTVKARALSSMFTGGFANPLFATVENAASLIISLLAIVFAPIAIAIIIIISVIVYNRNQKKQRLKKAV